MSDTPRTIDGLFSMLETMQGKIDQLANQPAPLNAESREIWAIVDIARYFGLSPSHISRYVINDSRFPLPIDMPARTGAEKAKKLWLAGDVVRFCEKHKQPRTRSKYQSGNMQSISQMIHETKGGK